MSSTTSRSVGSRFDPTSWDLTCQDLKIRNLDNVAGPDSLLHHLFMTEFAEVTDDTWKLVFGMGKAECEHQSPAGSRALDAYGLRQELYYPGGNRSLNATPLESHQAFRLAKVHVGYHAIGNLAHCEESEHQEFWTDLMLDLLSVFPVIMVHTNTGADERLCTVKPPVSFDTTTITQVKPDLTLGLDCMRIKTSRDDPNQATLLKNDAIKRDWIVTINKRYHQGWFPYLFGELKPLSGSVGGMNSQVTKACYLGLRLMFNFAQRARLADPTHFIYPSDIMRRVYAFQSSGVKWELLALIAVCEPGDLFNPKSYDIVTLVTGNTIADLPKLAIYIHTIQESEVDHRISSVSNWVECMYKEKIPDTPNKRKKHARTRGNGGDGNDSDETTPRSNKTSSHRSSRGSPSKDRQSGNGNNDGQPTQHRTVTQVSLLTTASLHARSRKSGKSHGSSGSSTSSIDDWALGVASAFAKAKPQGLPLGNENEIEIELN